MKKYVFLECNLNRTHFLISRLNGFESN